MGVVCSVMELASQPVATKLRTLVGHSDKITILGALEMFGPTIGTPANTAFSPAMAVPTGRSEPIPVVIGRSDTSVLRSTLLAFRNSGSLIAIPVAVPGDVILTAGPPVSWSMVS